MALDGPKTDFVSAFEMYKNKNVFHNDESRKKKRKRKATLKVSPEVPKKPKVKIATEQTGKLTKSPTKKIKKPNQNGTVMKAATKKSKKQKQNGKDTTELKQKNRNRKTHIETNVNNSDFMISSVAADDIQSSPPASVLNELSSSDNPVEDALQTFKWMVEPVSPKLFFKTYWEQKVLHIKRDNENYYNHIFNSVILDKIIRNNRLYYTKNVDVVCYEDGVKKVYNAEGKANPSALWDYYSNGCSIRILNPHTYCNKVHLLLASLQEYFGTMVGANVYLTPPNSQGFAPHFDDIEAFVIQLEGRKHWKLYQPKGSDVLARFSSPNLTHEDIGAPFMELTLNAGEVLYFPRGTIHEGCTDENSHSLHITVSVYQQTSYSDLLQQILPEALKRASEDDVDFRKGLPLNYLKHFGATKGSANLEFKETVKTRIENLVQSLVKYIDVDSAADQLGKKFMYDSMPPVLSKTEVKRSSKADGPFLDNGQVVNRVGIDLDTKIRLLRYYCIRLVLDSNTNPKLYYNTENANVYHEEEEQWLELDASMTSAISMLQNTYPRYIKVDQLPIEEEELKLQLISDLWEHGLIVTEQPLKPIDSD